MPRGTPNNVTSQMLVGVRARLAAIAVALTLLAGLGAPPATANAAFTFERLGGIDRYATAAAVALDTFSSASAAVLATGESFPDALAGSFVAGYVNAPILLVQRDSVPAATAEAMSRLGVREVVLLGGSAAISDDVAAELDETMEVVRLFGSDRFATAANIALAINPADVGEVNGKRTAFLANGFSFADPVAAGPLSYSARLPVLLTGSAGLGSPAATAIDRLDIAHVIVVGGPTAISEETEDQVEAMGVTTTRLFGADRFETATAVADFALENLDFVNDHFVLAKGQDASDPRQGFADALAGAPLAGRSRSPILLTQQDVLPASTKNWIELHAPTLEDGHILGSEGAVSSAVAEAATAAARSTGGEVVRVNKTSDEYTYVPDGADDAPTIEYGTGDDFVIDGAPASFAAFEEALSVADRVRPVTTADGMRHELTNVATVNGRTIGNVDLSDDEFDFINDVTGDALRGNVDYGVSGATFATSIGALADRAAFEAELNEGDIVTTNGTHFVVQNRTIRETVSNLSKVSDPVQGITEVTFKAGAYGDDHEAGSDAADGSEAPEPTGNDDRYRATGGDDETFVVDGDASDFDAFATQISEGDDISYARSGGEEVFTLTNRTPAIVSGTAVEIAKDGDGDQGINGNGEDGGSMTLLSDGGEKDVDYRHDGVFVIDGLVSTEGEFEAAFSEGDNVVFRPADAATGQDQRVELTNATPEA